MKILFVSTLYHPHHVGGAEATVRLLARAAREAGDETIVVTLSPDGGKEGVVDDTRVIYLPLANLYFPTASAGRSNGQKLLWHLVDSFNPVMARRLGAVLDRERPDVVSLHNVQGFSASAWRTVSARGLPAVQTLHDYYTGCLNSTMYRNGRNCATPCAECRLFAAGRRRYSRRLDGVTAVSHRQLERLDAAGVFRGVTDRRVIWGCNDGRSPPPTRARAPGRSLRLGFLGRLDPIKGLDWALDVIGRFPADRLTVSVAGRGEPAYEAALHARFGPPQVSVQGFVDPDDWFGSIDLLLVPSLWEEPLGRVIHEAMAQGVPILGAALGGIPELVREGRTGFLFRGGDADDLAAGLERLLETPPDLAAMAQACREAAEAHRLDLIYAQYREAWSAAIASREGAATALVRK